ncbi:hypothetical protein A2U01_0117863, partial [Trifolium medium]|nr:hypothetical protein [Trifolium medium]
MRKNQGQEKGVTEEKPLVKKEALNHDNNCPMGKYFVPTLYGTQHGVICFIEKTAKI